MEEIKTEKLKNPIDYRQRIITQLGHDYLAHVLVPVEFSPLCSVKKFWKQAHSGTYLLLTSAAIQPYDGAAIYITLLINGILRSSSARLLDRQLVGVFLVKNVADVKLSRYKTWQEHAAEKAGK